MVVAAFAVVGLCLGARAAQMSLAEGGPIEAFAAEQSVEQAAEPVRGSIRSADGRELATSVEAARVIATPYQVDDPDQTARELERVIGASTGKSAAEIESALIRRDEDGDLTGYSVVADVDHETAEKVTDLGLAGIYVAPDTIRVYPEAELASQLIGHASDYGEVFGGVEARYDKTLDAGKDVHLTLDTAVQQELQEALRSATTKYDAGSALGLVMRVEDGAIIALANTPGYDNNRFSKAAPELQRNRVLTDPYEPGSTFKPFTVAAALEEDAISPDDIFTVPDSIPAADRIIHDSMPHDVEQMTPEDILAQSSNVGTIKIARSLGGRRLSEYIERFGFGKPTGVDLWGEDPGNVPAYKEWSGSSIGNIPMGQGLTVTPLQLAAGYATLANGGFEVTPYVAQRDGRYEPGRRVISEETSDIVRGMLQGVVEDGTGHLARIPGYSVAGKTGTSQKVDPETGAYGDEYVSSFIGFAPASDPEYLALIVVDEPQGSIWGERVAAPAFQDVMSFTLGYFNVPPDRKEVSG